jgi:hypothetical protein
MQSTVHTNSKGLLLHGLEAECCQLHNTTDRFSTSVVKERDEIQYLLMT